MSPPSSSAPPTRPLPIDYTDMPTHIVTCVCASPTRVFTWDRLLEDSPCVSSSLPARVSVFTAASLLIPGISFIPIHMGPSAVTFWTFFVSAHSHVCMFVCLSTPAWLHLPGISIFAIATHSVLTHLYSLQRPLLLMLSLLLFATCHPKQGFQLLECLLPLQSSLS
jgi:hypothetical protein